MLKLIWTLRCTYYFMRHLNLGLKYGWYLASNLANDEFFDWKDYHPREAMLAEVSSWDWD